MFNIDFEKIDLKSLGNRSGKDPLGLLDSMKRIQSLENSMLNFIQKQETYKSLPYKNSSGDWIVGFDHKLKNNELSKFKNGITKEQAEELFKNDIERSKNNIDELLKENNFDPDEVPYEKKLLFLDHLFDLGKQGASKYKNYMKALVGNDYVFMSKNFRRFSKEGKVTVNSSRNKEFFETFLSPFIKEENVLDIRNHWIKEDKKRNVIQILKEKPSYLIHRIRPGQSLAQIAKKYKITVKSILIENPDVKSRNKLSAGDKLRILTL